VPGQKINTLFREPKALLVVSDTHFGGENCSREHFLHFLDWLREWEQAKTKVFTLDAKGEGTASVDQQEELPAPEVVILLGDIFEMWAPRLSDRTEPLRDALTIFDRIFDLECKKVYVIGNHDEELGEYYSRLRPSGTTIDSGALSWDYECANGSQLTIVRDHYPKLSGKKTEEWVKLGMDYYIFFHGHQFDKLFKGAAALQYFPGWMARFSSAYNGITPLIGWLGLVALSAAVVLGVAFALGASSVPLSILLPLTLLGLVFGLPKVWVSIQKPIWARLAGYAVKVPKYEDVETVAREYFTPEKYGDRVARTIVFGHTHRPDYHRFGKDEGVLSNMTFINSGSWVHPDSDADKQAIDVPYNTAVYVDSRGPILFRWDDEVRSLQAMEGPLRPNQDDLLSKA
jgi:UDP-2,3-diacylglucosamine pyrophosphatase LpxH